MEYIVNPISVELLDPPESIDRECPPVYCFEVGPECSNLGCPPVCPLCPSQGQNT